MHAKRLKPGNDGAGREEEAAFRPAGHHPSSTSKVLLNHHHPSNRAASAIPIRNRCFPTNHPIIWSAFYLLMSIFFLHYLKSSQQMFATSTLSSTTSPSSSYISSLFPSFNEEEAASRRGSRSSVAIIMVDNRDLFARNKLKPQRIWYGQMTADINRDYACKVCMYTCMHGRQQKGRVRHTYLPTYLATPHTYRAH